MHNQILTFDGHHGACARHFLSHKRSTWRLGWQVQGSRSGPRTSPKFVKIIPDKSKSEKMVAGMNKPFIQNPYSSFIQNGKQFRPALHEKET